MVGRLWSVSCWCKENVLLQFGKLYTKHHREALLFIVVERRWEYRAQHVVRPILNSVVRVKNNFDMFACGWLRVSLCYPWFETGTY